MGEWISVYDTFKPRDSQEILIYCEGSVRFDAGRYKDGEFQYFGWFGHGHGDEWQEQEDATHWMPLPEPPKQ